jgi:tRNA-2-methylthio-N6-dimethylallyladenosine synthase
VQVLVDGVSKMSNDDVSGRTGSNHVVNLPGPMELIGRLVDVHITRPAAHSLFGELA